MMEWLGKHNPFEKRYTLIRLIVPDSHGSYIDTKAFKAFLNDLATLDPQEIVLLGDHVDCSSVFSSHKKNTLEDLEYSYKEDIAKTNSFLDSIQMLAPKAKIYYLQGNHEQRIERWSSNTFENHTDASYITSILDPSVLLDLKGRGIQYFRMHTMHHGLSIPGTIRLGQCFFTHGITACKHAAATHVERFGANIVFGHVHRAQSHVIRTIASGEIGGWSPGTLAQLQPTYMHTNPSNWTHGYGLQFVNKGPGTFLHINVPIVQGKSLLLDLTSRLG